MIILQLLAGCLSIPDSIPNQAGQVTADAAPDLMTVASPDLVYTLAQTVRSLANEDFRTCPSIITSETGYSASADGCADSAKIVWTGTVTYKKEGTSETVSFNKFGVTGTEGDWLVTGTLGVTYTDSRSAEIIAAKLALTSVGETSKEYWVDTTTTYTSEGSDYFYSDTWSGEIGMEAWGLANVSGARTYIGFVNGCEYGASGIGTLVVESAAGRGDFRFHEDMTYQIPEDETARRRRAPPPSSPTDSGYTPIDSGDDTATTGGTTTGGTTTGGTTTGGTTTDTTDAAASCGCAALVLDGASAPDLECVVPVRTIAYPFLPVD